MTFFGRIKVAWRESPAPSAITFRTALFNRFV